MSVSTTKDEALKASIVAAEKYMQALKLTVLDNERNYLRQRCNALLKQAELIKNTEQWEPSNPLSSSKSSKIASSEHGLMKSSQPVSCRSLSKREQIILLEGSKLNGSIFPPWKSTPDRTEFDLNLEQGKFMYVDQ